MRHSLRIGIVQFEPSYNSKDNAYRLVELVDSRDVRADIIVVPEYANVYPAGLPANKLRELAEPLEDSPYARVLGRLAADIGATIFSGFYERSDDCRFSSVVLAEPSGDVRVVYRKNVLFDAFNVRESKVLCSSGMLPPLLTIHSVNISTFVCFELRFPEIARLAALKGAQLIVVPAAWYAGSLKEEHLLVHARSRAVENNTFIVIASLVGRHFTGRSLVVSPNGTTLFDAGIRQGYYEVEIDLGEIEETRRVLPLVDIAKKTSSMYLREAMRILEGEEEGKQL